MMTAIAQFDAGLPVESSFAKTTRDSLVVRLEDASLNATAVREQMFYDGWLVRWAPSVAKRVRSINVVGLSTRPLSERLAYCSTLYARHGLPVVLRVTSIGPDFGLDNELQACGFQREGETRVMSMSLTARADPSGNLRFETTSPAEFAVEVGQMRGSAADHVQEHQTRLQGLAVDIQPVLARDAQGECVAAGLAVRDGDLFGLFDVITQPNRRREGHANALVEHLLACGARRGAKTAYLQVEPENIAARTLYSQYGFVDSYAYWYRLPADQADA